MSAIADQGFRIESLKEYPFAGYQSLPEMIQGADGWWRLPDRPERLPSLFGLKATLPARRRAGGVTSAPLSFRAQRGI